ncbi:hypothetical protein SprV_0401423900 [Sparganum proliferum]
MASLLSEEEKEPPDRPPDTGSVTSPRWSGDSQCTQTKHQSTIPREAAAARGEKKIDQHEADQRDTPIGISGRLSAFYALTMESRPSSSKRQHPNKPVPAGGLVHILATFSSPLPPGRYSRLSENDINTKAQSGFGRAKISLSGMCGVYSAFSTLGYSIED